MKIIKNEQPLRPSSNGKSQDVEKQECTGLIAGRKMTWTAYGKAGEQLKNWILSFIFSEFAKEAQDRFFEEIKLEMSSEAEKARGDLQKVINQRATVWEKVAAVQEKVAAVQQKVSVIEIDIGLEKQAVDKIGEIVENILSISDEEMPRAKKMELVLEAIGDDPAVWNAIHRYANQLDASEATKKASEYLIMTKDLKEERRTR